MMKNIIKVTYTIYHIFGICNNRTKIRMMLSLVINSILVNPASHLFQQEVKYLDAKITGLFCGCENYSARIISHITATKTSAMTTMNNLFT